MCVRAIFQAAVLLTALQGAARAAEPCSVPGVAPTTPYRVLVIGDSWTPRFIKAVNEEFASSPGFEQFRATGHERPECSTAINGMTAARWNTAAYKQRITNALAAYPQVNVVHIILGINDLPMFGWPDSMDPVRREAAIGLIQQQATSRTAGYNWIASNIRGIVKHILAVRPGATVVIGSYDYLNMVDPVSEFRPESWWAYTIPGVAQTNPWFWQQVSNWMLTELERAKRDVVQVSPSRVIYLNALGLLQYMHGYKLDETDFTYNEFSYPAGFAPTTNDKSVPVGAAPPPPWYSGFSFLPSPPQMMADRGHLNEAGTRVHASWAVNWVYKGKLAQ